MDNNETSKWNISERLELAKELGEIKVILARCEERDLFMARMLTELKDDLGETKKVAYGAKSRTDRIYWLGGGFGSVIVVLETVGKWLRIH